MSARTVPLVVATLCAALLATPLLASTAGPEQNGRIAFVGWTGSATHLDSLSPQGVDRRTLARCTGRCGFGSFAWSPDGKHFAYLSGDPGCCVRTFERPSNVALFAVDAAGNHRVRVPGCGKPWPSCDAFAWAPDGSRVVVTRRGSLFVVETKSGGRRRIVNCPACRDVALSWSPDGTRIVFATRVRTDQRLYAVSPDGSGLKKIASGLDPSWSPDGRRIAYDGGGGVSVVDADGSNPTLLVAEGAPGEGPGLPAWSPDGKTIAYVRTPGTPGKFAAEIWSIRPDGSGNRLLDHYGCCIAGPPVPIWAPDGRRIAFLHDGPPNQPGLYVMDADGTHLKRLTSNAEQEVAWQPIEWGGNQ